LVVWHSWTAGKKILAWTLASRGQRAAVIERRSLGVPCLNISCLPNMNIIHKAKAASCSRRAEEFGISQVGWCIDMAAVHDHMRRVSDRLTEMHLGKLQAACAERHDKAVRELCRCCPVAGLNGDNKLAAADGDQQVGGSMA
jgi:pyruvate/2-oxoglutarate dehydrogenase complex dihydrolipoamide dehydrogenase (E3) component